MLLKLSQDIISQMDSAIIPLGFWHIMLGVYENDTIIPLADYSSWLRTDICSMIKKTSSLFSVLDLLSSIPLSSLYFYIGNEYVHISGTTHTSVFH